MDAEILADMTKHTTGISLEVVSSNTITGSGVRGPRRSAIGFSHYEIHISCSLNFCPVNGDASHPITWDL